MDKWEERFIKEFTYLDKENNPRINNKSPKKIKGFIKSLLKEQRSQFVKELKELQKNPQMLVHVAIAQLITKYQKEGIMDKIEVTDAKRFGYIPPELVDKINEIIEHINAQGETKE